MVEGSVRPMDWVVAGWFGYCCTPDFYSALSDFATIEMLWPVTKVAFVPEVPELVLMG